MSNSKTMSAISTSFKFAGEKVTQNLIEYVRRENVEITEDQLRGMVSIVESSVNQAFSLSSGSIEKTLVINSKTG